MYFVKLVYKVETRVGHDRRLFDTLDDAFLYVEAMSENSDIFSVKLEKCK